ALEMDGSEFIFAPAAAAELKLANIVSPELTFDVTSGIGTDFVPNLHNTPAELTGWDAGLFDFDRIDYDAF
ncbi:hypothetical protein, partial [Maricaulis sp.]